jgi:hypothetical protein
MKSNICNSLPLTNLSKYVINIKEIAKFIALFGCSRILDGGVNPKSTSLDHENEKCSIDEL